MYKIVFYEDSMGNSEVKDYFERIRVSNQLEDKKIYGKARHQIDMLSMLGPQLHMPSSRRLKGLKYPLMELRPQPERIFYVTWQKNKYILLSHYTKKQNRTDPKELKKALILAQDWFERNGK